MNNSRTKIDKLPKASVSSNLLQSVHFCHSSFAFILYRKKNPCWQLWQMNSYGDAGFFFPSFLFCVFIWSILNTWIFVFIHNFFHSIWPIELGLCHLFVVFLRSYLKMAWEDILLTIFLTMSYCWLIEFSILLFQPVYILYYDAHRVVTTFVY